MKFALLLVYFYSLFFTPPLFSSNDNNTNGPRAVALGNAAVTLSDVWCTSNNQAGLAYLKNISAGVSYENRFLLKELSTKAVSIAIPLKAGVFGISANTFGYKLYSENKYGLAFAKTFGEAISAGVQLNYMTTHIADGYGFVGIPTVEMGIQAKLTHNLTLGTHLFNPTRSKIANYNNERIPTIMRLGLSYKFSEKVIAVTEIQKDIIYKPQFKFGLEYIPIKELYLRAGFCGNPSASAFGFGLLLKQFKIDFASSFDTVLGFTPQVGLIYSIN